MPDIEIKRGYEVLPDNNIRFGIRITNISDLAVFDVEVILDFTESLFKLEGERLQKIGVIPSASARTAEFILKPLGCVHKVNIEALITYRDAKSKKSRIDMQPKEVHCVCPFLKGKKMPRAEFLELSSTGNSAETGLNFKGVTVERLTSFLVQTCKSRHYKVDDFSIDGGRMLYLASESIGEKAYYLLTALIKEYDELTQVMLRAVSDKPHGLNGFLNETVADLRHVVSTVQSAQEIGVIKKEQVINIIDSVVQRSTISMGEGAPSIKIKDSVVQRAEIKGEEEEDVQLIIEPRTTGNWVKIGEFTFDLKYLRKKQNEASDFENESGYPVAFGGEKWTKGKPVEFVETPYGLIGVSSTGVQRGIPKKLKDSVKRKDIVTSSHIGRLLLDKAVQKEEDRQLPEEREDDSKHFDIKKEWFAVALVLGVLLIGYWVMAPGASNETLKSTLSPTPIITSSADQKNFTNSIGMEFMQIPAGEFDMGSPSNEAGRNIDEGPVHRVKIAKAFYMGKYEVTQKQWREVMGTNPSNFKGDNLPVGQVSWNDAQEFVKKLNEKEGANKYRLPSEAEWEYAARAGTTTRYSFGDDESKLGDYAWFYGNSGSKTHDVGQKKPNPWGLYDMHGNVWEWVQDIYQNNYNGAPTDGSAWESSGSGRVVRGGSWYDNAQNCRSAFRDDRDSGYRISFLGFRLLRIS